MSRRDQAWWAVCVILFVAGAALQFGGCAHRPARIDRAGWGCGWACEGDPAHRVDL